MDKKNVQIQKSLSPALDSTIGNICPLESRYIRTTWMFNAKTPLLLPAISVSIRTISANESQKLMQDIRKRNVFMRHSWENDFYCRRIESLANKSVIEVHRQGNPDQIIPAAEKMVVCLDCCKSALPLLTDSTHTFKGRYLLPVIQSSLIFARD